MSLSVVVPVRSALSYDVVRKNLENLPKDELVVVEGQNPSRQRNEGVKSADGDVIYFIDDDSKPSKESVEKALALFASSTDVDVIGGPVLTPKSDSFLQKSFGAVFSSVFAAGSSSSRYAKKGIRRESGEKELILCNMFVRKTVFERIGGFREELYPNEENEFLNRLKKYGGKIIYDPDIYIERSQRKGVFEFINQCFRYGAGRSEQIKISPSLSDAVNIVPALFVLYLPAVIIFREADFFMLPLFLYAALALCFAAEAAVRMKNALVFMSVLPLFPLLHLAYGAGVIAGMLFYNPAAKKTKKEITIKKGSAQ